MKPDSRRSWPLVALLIVALVTFGLLALHAQRAEYRAINASLQRIEIVQKVTLDEINHVTYVIDSARLTAGIVAVAKPQVLKPKAVKPKIAAPPCCCKCSK